MSTPKKRNESRTIQPNSPAHASHRSKGQSVNAKRRFPNDVLSAIRKGMIIGLWAGTQPHRFIAVWAVVVEGRVFVRSWSLKPRSWYRTFLEEPRGKIQVAGDEFAVRAVHTRSERLKRAVDRAYLEKYHTPASIKFARDSDALNRKLRPPNWCRGRHGFVRVPLADLTECVAPSPLTPYPALGSRQRSDGEPNSIECFREKIRARLSLVNIWTGTH